MIKTDRLVSLTPKKKLVTNGASKPFAGPAKATKGVEPVFISRSSVNAKTVTAKEDFTVKEEATEEPQGPQPIPAQPRAQETAFSANGMPPSFSQGGVNQAGASGGVMEPLLVEDISDTQMSGPVNSLVNRTYQDIFRNDGVAGSAVELLATLPFSEFSLTGLRDEKALQPFMESCENIHVTKLLPEVTIDHFVSGRHVGAMSYDDTTNRYTSYIPFSSNDPLQLMDTPNFGEDPIITVTTPKSMIDSLTHASSERYTKRINSDLLNRLRSGSFNLKPEESVFIPRRSLQEDFMGTSYYRRLLPIWFYEKALIRGTRDSVWKRQKSIRHITVDETEDYEVDNEVLTSLANLLHQADVDPMSAIIATRGGVSISDIGSPESFWRWDNHYDVFSTMKLRAMNIDEAFITGSANFNTLEQTLSVFIEWIRNFRQMMTEELFYSKMFPTLAYKNNILKRRFGARETAEFDPNYGQRVAGHRILNSEVAGKHDFGVDMSKYAVPRVHWHKRLLPEADEAYLSILTTLEEKGMVIPMRVWAASGGIPLESMLEEREDDIKLREKFKAWKAEFAGGGEGAGDGGFGEFASMSPEAYQSYVRANHTPHPDKPRLTGAEQNPEQAEFTDLDSQGKRRVMTRKGRSVVKERFNKRLAAVLAESGRIQNARNKQEEEQMMRDR